MKILSTGFALARFLQTASERAQTVVILVSGNDIEMDNIVVNAIPDEHQVP